jgi:hypothetical protein
MSLMHSGAPRSTWLVGVALLSCLGLSHPAHARSEVNANADTPQSIPSNIATVVRFGEIKADVSGELAPTGRYTPRLAGYYRLSSIVALAHAGGAAVAVYVFKNGALHRTLAAYGGSPNGNYYGGDAIVYANGSTDFFDIRVWHNAGVPVVAYGATTHGDVSQFSASYVGLNPAGAVAATASTTQSVPHGVLTTVAFGNEEADPSNGFNGATGRYQPTAAGYYRISATVTMSGGSGSGSIAVYLYKNGALERTLGAGANSATGAYVSGSAVVYASGTDYFEIKAWQNSGGPLSAYGGPFGDVSQFAASKVSSGRVAFAAQASTHQLVPNATITKMGFGAEKFDPDSVLDSLTGTFVAPRAGFYRLSATLTFAAGNNSAAIYLYKNGRFYSQFGSAPNNGRGAYPSGTLVVYAPTPGTTFDIRGWQTSGGALMAFGGPAGDVSQFSGEELTPDTAYPATPPVRTEVFTLTSDVPVNTCAQASPVYVFDHALSFRGNALAQANLIIENTAGNQHFYNATVVVGDASYVPGNGDDFCPGALREKVNFGYGNVSATHPRVQVRLWQYATVGPCVSGAIVIKAGSTLTVYEEDPAYAGTRIKKDSWFDNHGGTVLTYDWQTTLSEMVQLDLSLPRRTTVLVTAVAEGTTPASPNSTCWAETASLSTEAWVGSTAVSQSQQAMPASAGMSHLVLHNEDWRQLSGNHHLALRVRKDPGYAWTVGTGGGLADGVIWAVLLDY